MASKTFVLYRVTPNDTRDSIINKFRLPSWDYLTYYDLNKKFRDEKRPPKENDILYIPLQFVDLLDNDRKSDKVFVETKLKMFFDGHMHIQSNNCSTMIHQWAAIGTVNKLPSIVRGNLKRRAGLFGGSERPTRKDLADSGSSDLGTRLAGRLIKLGRLPTYLVANLYMENLKNEQILRDDAWIVMKPSEYNSTKYNAQEMGMRAHLGKMNSDSSHEDTPFLLEYQRSFNHLSNFRINCALTFDLTFAHFWGEYGIPVYFDTLTDDNQRVLHYINDFISVRHRYSEFGYPARNSPYVIESEVDVYPNTYEPYRNLALQPDNKNFTNEITLLAAKKYNRETYSIRDQFERFCAFIDSSPSEKKHDFFMHFEGDRAKIKSLVDKKYTHFVEPVFPKKITEYSSNHWQDCINEEAWFEEYQGEQLLMSEAAAVAYPMNYLFYYNYDPRAHCEKNGIEERVKLLANRIVSDCAFFTYNHVKEKKTIELANGEKRLDNGTLSINQADKRILYQNGTMVVKPSNELNTMDYWKVKITDNMSSNDQVFKRLLQESGDGIFWGIKMYPRLGYDPSDYSTYPHLKELYSECVKLHIPIVIHCSQGGMMLADYHNYVRYKLDDNEFGDINAVKSDQKEADKIQKKKDKADTYNLDKADIRYTNAFASPDNWKKVLDSGYQNLTLRLAHFGGFPVWESLGDFDKFYEDHKTEPDNSSEYPIIYYGKDPKADLNNTQTFNQWVRGTAELIDCGKYPNVYTDISCFTLTNNPVYTSRVTKNLIFLLKKYPRLKERLLLGTDWPMIESNPAASDKDVSFGQYMNRMMLVLQKVSEELGYDAFYQFGYLNQMRFLGLLDDKSQTVNTDVLIKYRDRLINVFKNKNWLGKKYIHDNKMSKDNIYKQFEPLIDSLKNSKVKDSSEIKTKDSNLKILSYKDIEINYS